MLETKVIKHEVPLNEPIAMAMYEVVYNAAEPDDDADEDTWFNCHSSDPELWLSYGMYENEHVAQYIANNIRFGKIKVKTYKDD